MNNEKPIRRHSRLRYFLRVAKYHTGKRIRFPIGAALLVLFMVSGLITIVSIVYALGDIGNCSSERCGYSETLNSYISKGCIPATMFLVISYVLWKLLGKIVTLPPGHALNPLALERNEFLLDAEFLVRASSISDAAQKETLLRPAAAIAAAEPETLLRASTGNRNE